MASKRVFARMNKPPKFSSRRQSRCQITGRARGVYRKFGVSRIVLREPVSYTHLRAHETS